MRILFVTPQPPHPTQGGAAIRNWHLIDAAKQAGHQADLLTFGLFRPHDGEQLTLPANARAARGVLERVRDLAIGHAPDLVTRLGAEALRPHVDRLIRERRYDVIQVAGLELW